MGTIDKEIEKIEEEGLEEGVEEKGRDRKLIGDIDLFAPRLDIPLSNYEHHPINIMKNEGNAQVARGLEGIFGGESPLNLAIMDILIGLIKMIRKSTESEESEEKGGELPITE